MAEKDINQVLADHANEIMAIPGVVAVAVGALRDGTPCILVMLREDSLDVRRKIPPSLEGHPVSIDVSGDIRALCDGDD